MTVHDLSGTALNRVATDLGADGEADRVVADGTDAADIVSVNGSGGAATVAGLAAVITLAGAEPALDVLEIKARGDDDVVDASALAGTVARLTLDGGAGGRHPDRQRRRGHAARRGRRRRAARRPRAPTRSTAGRVTTS